MDNREDEPASRPENPLDGAGHRGEIRNIHKSEIANHSIKGVIRHTIKMLGIAMEVADA
jgi:hypothetical protein